MIHPKMARCLYGVRIHSSRIASVAQGLFACSLQATESVYGVKASTFFILCSVQSTAAVVSGNKVESSRQATCSVCTLQCEVYPYDGSKKATIA